MASPPTTANQLRQAFCDFFVERDHNLVPSAGLVPSDPTLLFTVAGMVPFKNYFLGMEVPPYKRAVSVQKCLRAGGKHNDLEEIGHTNRHLSFFEMMGNFSFGDYFKSEAISWAWKFSTEVLGFDPEDIWITVHISDDEAENIWREKVGVKPDKIQRLDEPNYWRMGDTGPCGPCSEMYFDRGEKYGPGGGPAGGNEERYMEFWNLVFMQYEQKSDGTQVKLPNPSIDTGAGLERILAILADADSIFDVGDLFQLVETARGIVASKDSKSNNIAFRIWAEHTRAACFTIVDGIIPSNEDRGYVVRRLIRRAIRYAHLLGAYDAKTTGAKFESAILPLAEKTIQLAGEHYPQLVSNQEKLLKVLEREESRFLQTLETGGELLASKLSGIKPGQELDGSTIFTLHDTYGFPYDLTEEIAKESGYELDKMGFEAEMSKQKERARADFDSKTLEGEAVGVKSSFLSELAGLEPTEFLGNAQYEVLAKVISVIDTGVVLDKTSFYAESGGQVGDIGKIILNDTTSGSREIEIVDTIYGSPGVVLHKTAEPPKLNPGDEVRAVIDGTRRDNIRRHHTATHILHWSLREILGDHISPQGSLVEASRLRFDFSHWEALNPEQIATIEDKCNVEILTNQPVHHFETTKVEAENLGAIGFFEEKYGEIVKVLEAGKHSIELCGGTHVSALGDIGPLKIISESSIGANIRRVEAICGALPVVLLREREDQAKQTADLLGVSVNELAKGAEKRVEEIKQLRQELGQLKSQNAMSQLDLLASQAESGVLATKIEGVDRDTLRRMAIALRDKKSVKVAVLGAELDSGGAALIAALASDVVSNLTAGDLLKEPVKLIAGGGGKGEDLAVAGGKDASGLESALKLAKTLAIEKLG